MPDNLSQHQKRTLQYWYTDGSYELGFGLICLIIAAYFAIEQWLKGSWASAVVDASLVLVLVGGSVLVNWLLRKWKERVTYPRTGYVAYRRETSQRRLRRNVLRFLVSGLLAGAVIVLISQPFWYFNIIPLVSGMLIGLVITFLAWRTSLPRFYLLAAFSIFAGIAMSGTPWGDYTAIATYYLALGLALILSGSVTLILYLHRNPLEKEQRS